nr:tyrosine-type recombinase/integrase [Acaryochloris sp. IP29b_bin.137]
MLHLIDHGLRASEIHRLNVEDYDGQRLTIRVAKADSVGTVPLLKKARKAIDQYKLWREQQGDILENDSPLFVSHSNNSKGKRLQYWGIYKIFKAIADIAEVENAHPHRGRHTLATRLVMKDMDSVLARRITRHASEQSFVRYSDRGIELKAEQEFYEVHGEAPGNGEPTEKPESIQLEAVVEEPTDRPQITSVGHPLNSVSNIYQLKITLLGVRPQVWRRIQVPETTTLAQLHTVIQAVMGWEGYHLHQFSESEDETLTLAELLGDDLFPFGYTYDFGDMWQHEIKVEKRLASKPGKDYPVCLAGKRACPPEDCGGDWGYAHLLRVLKNHRHSQYEERMEWVGSDFDPKAFDLVQVNQSLRELEVEAVGYS